MRTHLELIAELGLIAEFENSPSFTSGKKEERKRKAKRAPPATFDAKNPQLDTKTFPSQLHHDDRIP
jgi:hypothetical protein